jgi:hypothetical protein
MSYQVLPNSPCIGLIMLEPCRSQSVMKQNGAGVAHIVRERHQAEMLRQLSRTGTDTAIHGTYRLPFPQSILL